MLELISGIAEALASYIIGNHQAKKKTAFQLSAILISLVCGLIFFIFFGLYELLFPAPNPKGNMWLFLLLLSTCASIFAYAVIAIDYLVKKRKYQQADEK